MIQITFSLFRKDLPLVTSKEIYVNGDTEKYHPDGLYSEIIFGPKNAYKCTCGAITGRRSDGEKCDFCGVTCNDGTQRSKQFAKIKLPKKFLVPIFKKALQSIYGLKQINDVFNRSKYLENLTEPFFYDIKKGTLRKRKMIKNLEATIFSEFPVYDIFSMNKLFDMMCSDIEYKNIIETVINPDHFDVVFCQNIVVIPPNSRPIVKSGAKKDIPDIGKMYKQMLSLSTSSFWDNPEKTSDEEFNKNIYHFQKLVDEYYNYLYASTFLNKNSLMKESYSGSTVEFSQRSTIIPNPALKPYCVGVSLESTMKLYMPNFLGWLNKRCIREMEEKGTSDIDVNALVHLTYIGNVNFDIRTQNLFLKYLDEDKTAKKAIMERAPVLWRYNASGVIIEFIILDTDGYEEFDDSTYFGPRLARTKLYNNRVVQVNTIVSTAFNFDFDGDTVSIYALHSEQTIKKDFYDAFLGSPGNIEFEHNNDLIPNPEHEAVYAAWALTNAAWKEVQPLPDEMIHVNNEDFYLDIDILNKTPGLIICVYYNEFVNEDAGELGGIKLPYAIACMNKALGIPLITENPGPMPKKKTKQLIKALLKTVGHENFYAHFHEFNKFLLWCSTIFNYGNPTFRLRDFAINNDKINNYKDTLINEPFLGFHQNDILFTDYVKPVIAEDKDNSLYKVSESDARIKSVQLLKASSNNGIPTDIHGRAFIMNIKEDLLTGHTKEGFFISGDSARLALAQRQEAIPKGGELQRRFFWVTGFLRLSRTSDCGSKRTSAIKIRNAQHLSLMDGRFHTVLENGKVKVQQIDINNKDYIGQTLHFRAPIYCEQSGYKVCDCCMGSRQPQSINLGAAIGSYISESIIQSVLRTHHFSGAFITQIKTEILDFIKRNRFQSPNLIFIKEDRVQEEVKVLQKIYENFYTTEDIKLVSNREEDTIDEECYKIEVINPPFNDDSVKQLNKIINIIDRDRSKEQLMSPEDMYEALLDEIVLPNGILSIYIELIMSIMFFDEDDVMIRYGGEPDHQTAIKNIIIKCDPRLTIFYTFNPSAVANILSDGHKILGADHMYSDLLKVYNK